MKLCKTPFVQRLTRKKRHCTKSFDGVQQRKDSTSSPWFPRTLLLLRLFCYDLAKVLHTFSLQWLIYTHVVAIYTHTKKKKEKYCRRALRQLATTYGEKGSVCTIPKVESLQLNPSADLASGPIKIVLLAVKKVDALLFHLH